MFRCIECGGKVYRQTHSKRIWKDFDNRDFKVPDWVLLEKCNDCGETYTNSSDEAKLDEMSYQFYSRNDDTKR